MTTRRTSIKLTPHDDFMLDEIGRGISAVFHAGLDREFDEYETGDIWIGTGIWKGWRLTTAHSSSNHGQPVLVGPDGVGRGPDDL